MKLAFDISPAGLEVLRKAYDREMVAFCGVDDPDSQASKDGCKVNLPEFDPVTLLRRCLLIATREAFEDTPEERVIEILAASIIDEDEQPR
jgi:hypothetical protein